MDCSKITKYHFKSDVFFKGVNNSTVCPAIRYTVQAKSND